MCRFFTISLIMSIVYLNNCKYIQLDGINEVYRSKNYPKSIY